MSNDKRIAINAIIILMAFICYMAPSVSIRLDNEWIAFTGSALGFVGWIYCLVLFAEMHESRKKNKNTQ